MDIQSIVKSYLDTWNLTEPRARRARIQSIFADECSYTDPAASVAGREAIDGFIGAVQEKFAGVSFALAGSVDAHHNVARFTWHALVAGSKEPVAIGFDVVAMEGDRIKQVVGFLDKAPG